MNTRWLSAFPLLLVADPVAYFQVEDCEYTAERSAAIEAASADQVRILAAAGELRVEGRPGLTEVRVRGRACASEARYLDAIRLVTRREGGSVVVQAQLPEESLGNVGGYGGGYAALDLVVEVPATLALDVSDTSGDVQIRRVGGLRLRDNSGDIRAEEIAGQVRVEDSSGDLLLRGVRGDVWLSDSSGDIDIHQVEGSVVVEQDSSGDIEITRVSRDVRIGRDSSGSIEVADVRGDFVVERDTNGGVRHRNVAGQVRVKR